MTSSRVGLDNVLTHEFMRDVQEILKPPRRRASMKIKASREGRKPVADWFPEPQPVEFKVSTIYYEDGDVQLSWFAGTKTRGNAWRVVLPFATIERLYRRSSKAKQDSANRAAKNAELEARLWCGLFQDAFPAECDRVENEVREFILRPKLRRKPGKVARRRVAKG